MSSARRDRIRAKIMARIEIDPVTGCWNWTGPTSGSSGRGKDYPRMSLDGQTVAVHIAMWTNEHGMIPGKKELDHVCRNRRCINPDNQDHVQMVTRRENARRRERAKRLIVVCDEVAP